MKSVFVAAALASLTLTTTADAATWQQVTASGGSNIDQVAAVRTADGVLHVAWHKNGDLAHTAIAPNGKVGATTPIQSGWASAGDPAIVAVPGGLRAFWGGIRTTDSNDPNVDLNTVDGNATASALDVLAQFGVGTTSDSSTFVTRVAPGLTLQAKKLDHATRFTVTDAGAPVKSAKVKFAGRSGKTDAKGHVTLNARKGTATASASGYEDAKLKVK